MFNILSNDWLLYVNANCSSCSAQTSTTRPARSAPIVVATWSCKQVVSSENTSVNQCKHSSGWKNTTPSSQLPQLCNITGINTKVSLLWQLFLVHISATTTTTMTTSYFCSTGPFFQGLLQVKPGTPKIIQTTTSGDCFTFCKVLSFYCKNGCT